MIKPSFRLARIGAVLFATPESSALVMAQTGMASERILLEQPPFTRWFAITNECEKAGLLPTLVEAMLEHYPEHAGLLMLRYESKEAHLMLAVGSDPALRSDVDALRSVRGATGLEFIQLLNVSLAKLTTALARERANEQPVLLHLAVHAGVEGVLLEEGWIPAAVLSGALTGVRVLVLASCNGSGILDGLRSIPFVVAIDAEITHEDASLFTRLFWSSVGKGMSPEKALRSVLPRLPNAVREFIAVGG